MGEHADDKSVEQMLDDEAQQIARQQAETETCQHRSHRLIYVPLDTELVTSETFFPANLLA